MLELEHGVYIPIQPTMELATLKRASRCFDPQHRSLPIRWMHSRILCKQRPGTRVEADVEKLDFTMVKIGNAFSSQHVIARDGWR